MPLDASHRQTLFSSHYRPQNWKAIGILSPFGYFFLKSDRELYSNYTGGVGTQILKRNKRKRDDNEQQDDDDRPSKRTRDVGLIAEHC